MERVSAQPPKVLLVDYGEVISRPQPAETLAQMARTAGLELPVFVERYWAHRPAYDRGTAARTYWSAVVGSELTEDAVLDKLSRLDLESWSHLNSGTLEVLSAAHERGCSLSLLSNAPYDLAAALTERPPLGSFEHLLFSSRLGVMKPDRAVFHAALDTLGRRPAEVLFIDDRPANVRGAIDAGMRAVLFTSPEQLRAELDSGWR